MVEQVTIKGSALPVAATIESGDQVVVIQGGTTKRAVADLLGVFAGLSWEGAWSSLTAYTTSQGVSHNGESYIAIAGSTNKEPGVAVDWATYWNLLAEKGEKGATGLRYLWDTGTSMADPGAGRVRGNNATPASITSLAISVELAEAGNPSVAGLLATFDDSTTTGNLGRLLFQKIAGAEDFLAFSISGALTDHTTWIEVPVTFLDSGLAGLTNSEPVSMTFFGTGDKGEQGATGIGQQGPQGPAGADGVNAGQRMTFSDSTLMQDPGIGKIALNNSAPGSVTQVAFSAYSAISGNPDISAIIASWSDSTTTADRGRMLIKNRAAPANQLELKVNGTITDNSSWLLLPVAFVAVSGTFADTDDLSVEFYRTGNSGAGTGDVVGPGSAVSNRIARFDGTSGKLLKDGGQIVGSDLQVSGANKFWVADGVNNFTERDITTNGLALVAAANYAAMRALLDLEAGTDFLSPAAIAAAYQPLDSDLTAIAALTTTSFGRALLALADAAAGRTAFGLGTVAVSNTGTSGNNVPLLDGKNTWTNCQTPTAGTLTHNTAADFSTEQVKTAAVSSAFTIPNPSADPPSSTMVMIVISMTAAGAVSWGNKFKGLANYTQSTWVSGTMRDVLTFRFDGTNYDLVGVMKGVNQ